jgi:hypothetical protein
MVWMEAAEAGSTLPEAMWPLPKAGMKVLPLRNLPFTIRGVRHWIRAWEASGTGSVPAEPAAVNTVGSVQAPVRDPVVDSSVRPLALIEYTAVVAWNALMLFQKVPSCDRWVATGWALSKYITVAWPVPDGRVQSVMISRRSDMNAP